jgi:hypothetical protein
LGWRIRSQDWQKLTGDYQKVSGNENREKSAENRVERAVFVIRKKRMRNHKFPIFGVL